MGRVKDMDDHFEIENAFLRSEVEDMRAHIKELRSIIAWIIAEMPNQNEEAREAMILCLTNTKNIVKTSDE